MMADWAVSCRSCGCQEWRIQRVANDEPEDPERDWMSTLSAVCGGCKASAITLTRWYDKTVEVTAFDETVVRRA
jgi:thymidine kinase